MQDNHLFVDGSALLGDIRRTRRALGLPADSRLKLTELARYFTGKNFSQFHGDGFRRFTFYFVADDERLRANVVLPEVTVPGAIEDLRIEYCGRQIRQFGQAREWLEQKGAPDFVKECVYRSEKAVDTQICCDALQLAANRRLDRLFLYTNDFDFVPLCRTLRQLGCNTNLFRLRAESVNADLVQECDAFHVVDAQSLPLLFDKQMQVEASSAEP